MAKIGKKEIVNQISNEITDDTGLSKKEIDFVVTKLLEKIVENVKSGNKVSFIGFGTFKEKKSKAREGVNLQTKEKIKIPAFKTISFKASDKLKETL